MACVMDGVYALIANLTVTGIELILIAVIIVLETQTLIVVKPVVVKTESVFMKLILQQMIVPPQPLQHSVQQPQQLHQ